MHDVVACDPDERGDLYQCISGQIYGPCDSEYCCGVCEYHHECLCLCHGEVDEDV